MLHTLKFTPVLERRIWGGQRLCDFGKKIFDNERVGESWELSGMPDKESVVANGLLADNTINELLEVYMDELAGGKVFQQYGKTFPLLFKLIDASSDLSVQVHPNDEIARIKHNSFGKTEMWYIVDAAPEAKIVLGFNKKMNAAALRQSIENNTLTQHLNYIPVKKGDAFYIPAGTIHAIGGGMLIAEIQQASNITYRLYDYGRLDENGNPRDLHIKDALEAIDYESDFPTKIIPDGEKLIRSEFFNVNKILFSGHLERDYCKLDSFVVLMCVAGKAKIGKLDFAKGETVLVPASMKKILLQADSETEVLETWIG